LAAGYESPRGPGTAIGWEAHDWEQALAAGRPAVLDFRTGPDVPPIPPHATFEQVKDAAKHC
jgi:hypothetical protein